MDCINWLAPRWLDACMAIGVESAETLAVLVFVVSALLVTASVLASLAVSRRDAGLTLS